MAPLFLLIVSPVPRPETVWVKRLGTLLAAGIAGFALIFGIRYAQDYYLVAQHPATALADDKQSYVALDRQRLAEGKRLNWMPYFDTVAPMPKPEAYYRFGSLLLGPTRQAGRTLFSNTALQTFIWDVDYPGPNPEEISSTVYSVKARSVDIAVVFDDPHAALGRFATVQADTVAYDMAARVQSDSQWEKIFVIDSAKYGPLAGYRNRSPQPGHTTNYYGTTP